MTPQETVDILAIVSACTSRTFGPADTLLWHEIIGDCDKADARQAVLDVVREHPHTWIEPGDVYQQVRAIRRDRFEREEQARLRYEALCDAKAVPEPIAALAAAKGIPDDVPRYTRPSQDPDNTRAALLTVSCRYCHAGAGQRCYNAATKKPLDRVRAHPIRQDDAAAHAAGHPAAPTPEPPTAAVMPDPGPLADPCLRCHRWVSLGPEAHRNENPRWCGACNFEQLEFLRLQKQDETLGDPVRTSMPKTKAAERNNA
jgi:hypothetical protein